MSKTKVSKPTNRRTDVSDDIDFFPTPAWCVEALLAKEKFNDGIWEPACGDGAISEVLRKAEYVVYSTDKYDHGYSRINSINDFLAYDIPDNSHTWDIITNPPYCIANEFVQKALDLGAGKIAFLVRLAFLEGQKRYKDIFAVNPPARVWVFSERITMYKKYADKKGSGTTAYCWVVWDRSHEGPTQLKWIEPGFKK